MRPLKASDNHQTNPWTWPDLKMHRTQFSSRWTTHKTQPARMTTNIHQNGPLLAPRTSKKRHKNALSFKPLWLDVCISLYCFISFPRVLYRFISFYSLIFARPSIWWMFAGIEKKSHKMSHKIRERRFNWARGRRQLITKNAKAKVSDSRTGHIDTKKNKRAEIANERSSNSACVYGQHR